MKSVDPKLAYDSLNRINDAVENVTPTGGSASQSWKQTFTFDRYGNRNFVTENGQTTTLGSCPTAVCNPTISPTNNRITSTGYSYDSSGNTTADANGQVYVYDAENKMVSASNGSGTLGEYSYDGDGKRVKKYVPSTGETTIFVYDSSGKLVAEYSTIVASTNDAKVNYLTADHLGSPRINTDANGSVTTRHDYHPFGEEIDGVGGRTTGLNYGDDSVRKQFTGYERDNESDLDFAQARMFGYTLGRFTSPDPLSASAKPGIPQSWNRYVYVLNNPLVLTDPTGMVWGYYDEDGKRHFHWFSGKAGKFGGHTYSTYDGPSVISNTNAGRQIRLLDGGRFKVLKALPASTVPTSNSSRSSTQSANPSGGGYVNNALIKSVADESVKKGTTAAIAGGAAVVIGTGGGACLALCPSVGAATVTTLGIAGADYVATHPNETEEGIEALGRLMNTATGWEQLASKTQGFAQGNAQQVFDQIAQGGTKIADNIVRLGDGRVVTLYNSATNGIATIQIAGEGVEKTVIRITQ